MGIYETKKYGDEGRKKVLKILEKVMNISL